MAEAPEHEREDRGRRAANIIAVMQSASHPDPVEASPVGIAAGTRRIG